MLSVIQVIVPGHYSNFKILCYLFPLRRFDPIRGHGLPLRGLAITFIGQTTLGRTPLDE
jgi:hypothetical protein